MQIAPFAEPSGSLPHWSDRRDSSSGGQGGPAGSVPNMKAFAVLQAAAQSRFPLGISEFHVLLGLPKPTVHRLVRMLEADGLLQREPGTRRYVPGGRLVEFGLSVVGSAMRAAPRRAILERLSNAVGETCNFGTIAGSSIVYLERVEAAWPFGLHFRPGSRVPLYCTSIGKLLLSQMRPAERRRLLGDGPMHRYTESTIADPERLDTELDRIAAAGISTDNQEFLAGVVCTAVPVTRKDGRIAAAIAVSAPVARLSLERMQDFVPTLRSAALELSQSLHDIEGPAGDGGGTRSKKGKHASQL